MFVRARKLLTHLSLQNRSLKGAFFSSQLDPQYLKQRAELAYEVIQMVKTPSLIKFKVD
jgi:hypothetical protein